MNLNPIIQAFSSELTAMPRRSSRAAPAAGSVPATAPKRRASTRLAGAKSPPKKQKTTSSPSKAKAAKSTAKQSKYFNKESTEEYHSSLTDYESDSQSSIKAVKGKFPALRGRQC